jgi:exopolysaccharide biosynthesis polyprenyl glycosylphosphotransferase
MNTQERLELVATGTAPAGDLADPRRSSPGRPPGLSPRTAKALVVACDSVAVVAAMWLAFHFRAWIGSTEIRTDVGRHILVGAVSLPAWIVVFARYRLYTARHVWDRFEEVRRIVHAVAVAVALQAVTAFSLRLPVARGWLILSLVNGIALVSFERALVRRAFDALRRKGHLSRPVVIVGTNAEGTRLTATIGADRSLGYQVVGRIDEQAVAGPAGPAHEARLVDNTLATVARTGANGVVIATSGIDASACNALTRALIEAGVHVELSSSLHDIAPERLTVRGFGGHALMHVRPVQRHGWRARAKRVFDIVVASAVLAVTAPFLIAAAALIRLTSKGPVLFRQKRVGRGGVMFEMLKLRTMVNDAEGRLAELRHQNEADGPMFKIRSDPRVTRVGRVLRRFSIDEFPQLWNVLRGEMTLVGPRPALPEEMREWGPEVHHRLAVNPGITGMWQVSGRSILSFDDYTRLDLYYVDNWSLWRDLVILCRTVPALFSRRGAY